MSNSLSRICLALVAVSFFFSAVTVAFFQVINADNLKTTAKEEKVYENFVPATLSTASAVQLSQGQLPLGEPWVQEAAKKAFPSDDLEKKGDLLLDGSFAWLKGETEKPEFQLDFTQNKQVLAQEIGNSTQSRLLTLPSCALNQIPETIDPYTINCLPRGVSPQLIGQRVESEIRTSPDFLQQTNINADQITREAAATNQPDPFQQLENLRSFYQLGNFLPWVLPILTVLLGVLGVLSAQNKLRGVRSLYRSLFSVAVGLLVLWLILQFALKPSINGLARDQFSRDIVSPVFTSLISQIQNIYLLFVAIAAITGLILLGLFKKLSNSQN